MVIKTLERVSKNYYYIIRGGKIKMGMTTLCYIEKDNKYLTFTDFYSYSSDFAKLETTGTEIGRAHV